jgi:hypothetical protein
MAKKPTQAEQEAKARWLVHHEARKREQNKIALAAIARIRPDMEMAFICGEAPRWFESIVWKCKIEAVRDAIKATPRGPRSGDDASDAEHAAHNEAYLPEYAKAFTAALTWALRKHTLPS